MYTLTHMSMVLSQGRHFATIKVHMAYVFRDHQRFLELYQRDEMDLSQC